jgi:ArsR family transcriptional regulator, arsenate/arsenite/antimonite-responsive transcriptional repressor
MRIAMNELAFSNEQLSELTRWLKVICEPNRLLLLEKIIEGVQCNCELGSALQIAPNLISHHLGVLREAGLVDVERDPIDGRWVYYSINLKAMDELRQVLGSFFDPERIQARRYTCGPQAAESDPFGLLKLEK